MSIVNLIEAKLRQIEGGVFQRVAQEVLRAELHPDEIGSMGFQQGTDKTTPGQPDSYFCKDGEYTLIAFTTRQDGIVKKLQDDLRECHAVEAQMHDAMVNRIILCHTRFRLEPEVSSSMRSMDSRIWIIGPEKLTDMLLNHRAIAHDLLDIPLGNHTLITSKEFIARQRNALFATDQSKPLLYRDELLELLIECITNNQVVLVSGPAGTGKTKLALEACGKYSDSIGCDFFVLESRYAPDADKDIEVLLTDNGKKVVLVDDANQQTKIDHLLDAASRNEHLKCVLTVRDFAKAEVESHVASIASPVLLNVPALDTMELEHILERCYDVHDRSRREILTRLAHGSLRLAIMGTSLESESLDGKGPFELLDGYIGRALADFNEQEISILETMAVYGSWNVSEDDACYREIRESFSSQAVLLSFLSRLDEMGIITRLIQRDSVTAVRMEEQNLRDDLLYRYFVRERQKPFRDFLEINGSRPRDYFGKFKNIYVVLYNVFEHDQAARSYLYDVVLAAFNEVPKEDALKRVAFLKEFGVSIPDEALAYLEEISQQLIEAAQTQNSTATGFDFLQLRITDVLAALVSIYNQRPSDDALRLFVTYLPACNAETATLKNLVSGERAFTLGGASNGFQYEAHRIDTLLNAYEKNYDANIANALLCIVDTYLNFYVYTSSPLFNTTYMLLPEMIDRVSRLDFAQLVSMGLRSLSRLLDSALAISIKRLFRKTFKHPDSMGSERAVLFAKILSETADCVPLFLSDMRTDDFRCWCSIESIFACLDGQFDGPELVFQPEIIEASDLEASITFERPEGFFDISHWDLSHALAVLDILDADCSDSDVQWKASQGCCLVLVSLAKRDVEEGLEAIVHFASLNGMCQTFPKKALEEVLNGGLRAALYNRLEDVASTPNKRMILHYLDTETLYGAPTESDLDRILASAASEGFNLELRNLLEGDRARAGFASEYIQEALAADPHCFIRNGDIFFRILLDRDLFASY